MLKVGVVLTPALLAAYCVRSTGARLSAPPIVAGPKAADTAKATDPRDIARGIAARMALPLRRAMKDPKSFELEEALFMADDSACYTYFARNSFNARIRGYAVWSGGQMRTSDGDAASFRKAWADHCNGKSGEPLTAYINRFVL